MQKHATVLLFNGSANGFDLLDDKRQVRLRVEDLRSSMAELLDNLADIVPAEPEKPGGIKLKTVTVAVGISGKGQVGLLGTGVEVGGSATFTLTFDVA